jgi:hypothetical protein
VEVWKRQRREVMKSQIGQQVTRVERLAVGAVAA